MKNKEQRERIIKYLKEKNCWVTTTSVALATKLHYYKAALLLTEMYVDKEVEKDEKEHQVYWKLKEEEKANILGGLSFSEEDEVEESQRNDGFITRFE